MNDNLLNNYTIWINHMRVAIAAATIVHLVRERLNMGAGTPTVEDMKRYSEEGEAVADLWEKSLGEVK